MSDIPFIDTFGDELAVALARDVRASRKHRVRLSVLAAGAALLALAAAGLAVAHFEADPQALATGNVACYSDDSLLNVTVIENTGDPVAACAGALGETTAHLVACAGALAVAVIPGEPQDCARLHLAALPADYAAWRAKTQLLEGQITRLEAKADCTPVATLAQDVDGLLLAGGWAKWHTALRGSGRCGSVSTLDGNGERGFSGAFDAGTHTVFVWAGPSRSTSALLWSQPNALAVTLEDASVARCSSVGDIRSLAAARAAAAGRAAELRVAGAPPGVDFGGSEAGARYAAGCAIVADVGPQPNGRDLVVEVWRR